MNFITAVNYEDVDTDTYFEYIDDYPNSLVEQLAHHIRFNGDRR